MVQTVCWPDRPSTGVDAVTQHRHQRLPILTDKKWRNRAFHRSDAARRFGIPRRDSVPDTPDILPAFPADAVEEGELQVVCLVALPAI